MALRKPFTIWKIWLAGLLAGLLLFGPAVSEAAAESVAHAACHAELDSHAENALDARAGDLHGDEGAHGDIKHHAHGCGGCHIHVVAPALFMTRSPERAACGTDFGVVPTPRKSPNGLFRPPRL